MKKQLTSYLLLLFIVLGLAPVGPACAANTTFTQAAPSQAYFLLANEIANLFQQLEKLPAAQGTVLLRQKAPALQARIKQVRTAYQKYLKSLSATELKAENERVAQSHWGNYFAKLELAGLDASPRLKSLMKPGSPSGQTILDLMEIFDRV
jgi:hypothetical protein